MNDQQKINKKTEDWMQSKWRPMMAMMYMTVCVFDFIVFPIMFTIVQFWETSAANDAFRQWQPLTLIGAGLFHMAMGAVLGITAWSRGQEKMAGVTGSSPTPSLPGPAPTPSPAISAPSAVPTPRSTATDDEPVVPPVAKPKPIDFGVK